jgi:hypothetical protein
VKKCVMEEKVVDDEVQQKRELEEIMQVGIVK